MTKKEYYLENVYGGNIPTKTIINSSGEEVEISMTEEEFDELIANSLEIEEREADNSYALNRISEYPSIEEQMDTIYKGFKAIKDSGVIDLGVEVNEMIDRITAVKEKYPKN
jgi:hypothetical protein